MYSSGVRYETTIVSGFAFKTTEEYYDVDAEIRKLINADPNNNLGRHYSALAQRMDKNMKLTARMMADLKVMVKRVRDRTPEAIRAAKLAVFDELGT